MARSEGDTGMIEGAGRRGGGRAAGETGETSQQVREESGAARRNAAAQSFAARLPQQGASASNATWGPGRGVAKPEGNDPVQSAIEVVQRATTVDALKKVLDEVRTPADSQPASLAALSDDDKSRVIGAVALRVPKLPNDSDAENASVAPLLIDAADLIAGLRHGADDAYLAVHAAASVTRRRMGEPAYAQVLTALASALPALPTHRHEAAVLELMSDVREISVSERLAPWLALARVSSGNQEPWPWTREQLLSEAQLMPRQACEQIRGVLKHSERRAPAARGAAEDAQP